MSKNLMGAQERSGSAADISIGCRSVVNAKKCYLFEIKVYILELKLE